MGQRSKSEDQQAADDLRRDVKAIRKATESLALLEFVTRILIPYVFPVLLFLGFVILVWFNWK